MSDDSKVQQFVLLAKGARGKALADLISKATAAPGVYGFGELLASLNVAEVTKDDLAPFYSLLQLFAFGTWADYKAQSASLPQLNEQQSSKLKQLTVVSLALQTKVIPYTQLQQALDISTVRQLEDFLITECFYAGLIKGKLDQRQACLHIHDVVGRDVRQEQVQQLEAGLLSWLHQAEALITSIEARVAYANQASETADKKRAEAQAKAEEMKKNVKAELELRSADMMLDDPTAGLAELMEEDRFDGQLGAGALTGLAGERERQDRAAPRQGGRRRLR
ncbi:hypothetical protein V8C86DRAFT_1473849 [Haematococcus lacustris]